jgi:hypothetical protein
VEKSKRTGVALQQLAAKLHGLTKFLILCTWDLRIMVLGIFSVQGLNYA